MNENKDVFISYHTRSSSQIVERICSALESAGISCWYAPRNVSGDYATSIVQAINRCRVFLLILNRDADVSEDVRNEINCAFERFRKHEEITLLPFKVDEFKLSEAVSYYIGRIHIMDGGIPMEMLKIRELTDRISIILGHNAELTCTTETSKGSTSYRLSNSMICADAKFVGRASELSDIHNGLRSGCNKMFLVGMGGIGKSELIRKYVQSYSDSYSLVLWIPFQNSLIETICNDSALEIHGLSRQDYPDDSDCDYFLRKLKILRLLADKNVLLVIDNFDVDDAPGIDEFLKGEYSVLFSTRNRQHHPYVSQLQIEAMTNIDEMRRIFFGEYTRNTDAQAHSQIDEILTLLCGHPLSIRLVAATMQSRRIVPEKMLELLRNGKEEMIRSNSRAAEMIYGQLAQIFHISNLTEEEVILLCSLACLHLSGITVETLYDYCSMDDYDVIDRLIDRNWIIHNPASDEVHLHPRIAELMRKEINDAPSRVLLLVNSIRDIARSHQNLSYKDRCKLLEHVKNLYELKLDDRYIRFVAAVSLGYMTEAFNRQKGIELFIEALNLADNPRDKLESYMKISHYHVLNEQFEKGLEYALKGCAMLETPGIDEQSLVHYRIKMWGRVGEALYFLGRYDESIAYLEKAAALCEKYQTNAGWTCYHLANAYLRSGNISRAIEVAEYAAKIFQDCGDFWSLGHSFIIRSRIMEVSDSLSKALEYLNSAMDTFLQVFGEEDSTFISLHFRKGHLLRLNGFEETAMDHFRYAKELALKYNRPEKLEKIDKYLADPAFIKSFEFL